MTINRRDENGNNNERNAANSSEQKIPSCIVYDCSRDMEGASGRLIQTGYIQALATTTK
jgi:hypothetical protein